MIKRIHVNQHVIKANATAEPSDRQPPLTVKTSRSNHKASEVHVNGPARIVYSPDKPLDCGAKVWIETTAPVLADGVPI